MTSQNTDFMNLKVYVVTDGDYSDYRIVGIFSTMEKAQELRVLCNSKNEIETYELDAVPEHPKGMFPYRVYMNLEGDTMRYPERISIEDDWYLSEERQGVPRSVYSSAKDNEWYIFSMWAKDEEHAVKIANERRTQLKAEGKIPITWSEWYKIWVGGRRDDV